MADKTALHPTIFDIRSFTREEKAEGQGTSDDEKALYALSGLRGWIILTEFANNALKELDEINKTSMTNGATFEEIGKNTVIISLAKDIVIRILQKVSDAVEAVDGQ